MLKKRTIKEPVAPGKIPLDDLKKVVNGVHVVLSSGIWTVRKTGRKSVQKEFPNQKDAIIFARKIGRLKSADIFVHGRNGRVTRENSAGDPVRMIPVQ